MKNRNRLQKTTMLIATAVFPLLGITAASAQNQVQVKPAEASAVKIGAPIGYIIQLSSEKATLAADYDDISRKNIYGICWEGKIDDNLKFAKQMGYSHVMYQPGMENSSLASDLHFLLQKPENLICPHLKVSAVIYPSKTYTAEEQEIYKSYFALKSLTESFPNNLGNGWYTFNKDKKPSTFAVVQDWQQKRVVDLGVDLTVAQAKRVENPGKRFFFGGLAWDEAELTGDFSSDTLAEKKGINSPVTLSYWTGGDFSRLYPGTTHEYATHSDGKAAFYKELKLKFRGLYPDRKLIYLWEPYKINGDLLKQIYARPDMEELLSDVMLTSEGEKNQLTQFADDASLFSSGLIKRDWVGSTQPNEHDFDKIKQIVGKAGVHGSWFGWFGRFNESGPPNNIYEILRWEQLARVIPSWDNLCGVPLDQRKWNGMEYASANSGMNDKVLYSRQPKTNKLFVVFLDPSASVPLNPGEKVLSVKRVDDFFCETTDAKSELVITKKTISLAKH